MKIPLLYALYLKQLPNEVHWGNNRRKMHAVFHVSGHTTSHEKSQGGRTIELSNRLLYLSLAMGELQKLVGVATPLRRTTTTCRR